jgi:tetratricopeptide (TPR) repeat protein
LTPDAVRLFRLLGLHPGPDISVAAAASLAGLPPPRQRRPSSELVRAHLVDERSAGRYALHDLLRAYATEQALHTDPDGDRRAAVHRVLDHYLHTAYSAQQLLDQKRDPIVLDPAQPGVTEEHLADRQQALAWFGAEHLVLLAAVNRAASDGFDVHTWQLSWALTPYLDRRGHWADLAAIYRTTLEAVRRLADPARQAHTHRSLARAYVRLGRYDDANPQYRNAVQLYREVGDIVGQAHTHMNLSEVFEHQGRPQDALDQAQKALDLYAAAGKRDRRAVALNSVGWYHTLLGDHDKALAYCQQALATLQEIGDHHAEASTWDSLGHAYHHLGQHDDAVACYHKALALFQSLADRYSEPAVLNHLGDTHHAAGDLDATRTAWQQALTILDDLGHPDADRVRGKLAQLPPSSPFSIRRRTTHPKRFNG